MLKRSDLAKQFELVVKQEIKNYNDSLFNIYQLLAESKHKIQQLEKSVSDGKKSIDSKNCSFKSELDSLKRLQETTSNELTGVLFEIKRKETKQAQAFEEFKNVVLDHLKEIEHFQTSVEDLKALAHFINESTVSSCRLVRRELNDWQFRFTKDITKMKEELLSKPSDSEVIRKDLEEKIASHGIDVEGLLKELRLTRKEIHIQDKKIEHLYTLINRLQKPGECS